MTLLFDAEGLPLELHARVGEGGEATVRHIAGRDGVLAKVYKGTEELDEHARKVEALVAMASPELERVAAWPRELVVDGNGQAVGFLMEHLKGWTPLFTVYQTRSRIRQVPHGDWGFLVRVTRNLAASVAAIHRAGLVIGDLNESNVLVSGQAMVKLIDVDSFQVEVEGAVLACPVGKAEYLAPELQGRDLDQHLRGARHDLFALAVLLFQTLMLGRHPFAGRPTGDAEPTLEEAVANHWYAYSDVRDVPLRPPPGVSTTLLPPYIAALFERAFGPKPEARPSARAWSGALRDLESELVDCPERPGHRYWTGLASCPWCRLERRSRTRLFCNPNDILPAGPKLVDDALADLEEAVSSVRSLPVAVELELPPGALALRIDPAPLPPRKALLRRIQRYLLCGLAILATCLLLWRTPPFSVPIFIGFFVIFPSSCNLARISKKYRLLESELQGDYAELYNVLETWRRSGWADQKTRMEAKRVWLLSEVENKDGKYRQIRHKYLSLHHGADLRKLLSKYSILVANVSGLNEGRLNDIYDKGIRSAADIDQNKLAQIPALSNKTISELVEWRDNLSAKYWEASALPLPKAVEDSIDSEYTSWLVEKSREILELKSELVKTTLDFEHEQRLLLSRVEALCQKIANNERKRLDMTWFSWGPGNSANWKK